MKFKSILVATDLSVREDHAVLRAQQIALAHRSELKLMYLPHRGEIPLVNAARMLASLARQSQEQMQRPVSTVPVQSHGLDDLLAGSRHADLVVLPERHERSTAAHLFEPPLLQFMRKCSVPVLVARGTANIPYESIVVGADLSDRSAVLAGIAAGLHEDAEVYLYHALDTRDEAHLRSAEVSERVVRTFQDERREFARRRMRELTHRLGAGDRCVITVVERGDPGRGAVLMQQHTKADLLIVGTRQKPAWKDFLFGSVAGRILRSGASDVLVVPDSWMPTRAGADRQKEKRRRALPRFSLEATARNHRLQLDPRRGLS